jgi:hypothetical protein
MPTPALTPDEIVATLKKSSLPTVLVEGDEDLIVYRWIEARIGVAQANILPCGGRSTLLKVFERRAEIPKLKMAFVADRDMWLFTATPPQFNGMIWTDGYSIENDLYEPSNLESLLEPNEATDHRNLLLVVIRWFAFEVEEFRAGRDAQVRRRVAELIQSGPSTLCPLFCARRGFREPDPSTINEIVSNYRLRLRGKTLLQILSYFLNRPERVAKFSYAAQLEIALRLTPVNPRLERIIEEVRSELAA